MANDTEGMEPWEIKPGKIMPYDMIMPSAEVYVSPELALKAIDYLAEVLEGDGSKPELRVQAASVIITHHARRRPL